MRIEVEPQQLIGAGKQVGSLGAQLGALSDAMGQVLAGGIASGSDPAGLNFGVTYGRQADEFGKALADAANAFKNVGLMLEATGFNYRNADAASTPGGPGPSGAISGEQATTTAGDAPYGPNGSNVPPPGKWWLITPFLRMIPGIGIAAGVAMTWPSGNAAMMNLTAAQWRNIGQGLSVFEGAMAGAKASVDAQEIPEKGTIKTALEELGSRVSDLSTFASGLATTIGEFATGVQETQDAIRNLLNRISLDGLWDTVTGFLSGDGDRVLREIADDVSTVLENFQNQVKGVMGLLEELKTLLGEAADAFQKWIRPVLVETFGDQIGNRLADGIKLYTDIQVGAASGLINLVSGTVAMADPDTWKGLADTAMMLIDDPSKTDDVLKEIGSQFIALEQWQGDNPGRGFGEAAFNIGSLFVPGGALAKGGSVAKGLSATRHLLDKMDSGSPSRLPGLGGNRVPDMGELPDAPGTPDIPEFTPSPGIPESVLTPGGSDAPTRPQSVDPGSGSPGSGAGGVHAPAGPSGDGASGGGSSNGGPAPTGSPNGGGSSAGGGDGSSTNGPVPMGGSSGSGGGGDGSGGSAPAGGSPSGGGSSPDGGESSGGSTASPSISPSSDPSGSSGPSKLGGEDSQGSSSSGGGSTSNGGFPGGGDAPGDSSSSGGGGASNPDSGMSQKSDGTGSQSLDPNSADSTSQAGGDTGSSAPGGIGDRHGPVHSNEPSGDGWHRIEDKPGNPDYGRPLESHWESGDYPSPSDTTQSTFDLIERPDEPYGHDADGNPLSKVEYDARYNLLGPEGQHWENYPPNDGAVPGSRVLYESGDAFLRDYGQHLDRIGKESGTYLGVMPDGVPPSFEARGLPISSLNEPYDSYVLTELPENWSIEVSEIAPAFGRDGGGLQVLVYDHKGEKVSVEQLLKNGVLE